MTGRSGVAAWLAAILLCLACPGVVESQLAMGVQLGVGTPVQLTFANGDQQVERFEGESATGLHVRRSCDTVEVCDRLVTVPWASLRVVEAQVRGEGSPQRAAIGGLIGGAGVYALLLVVAASTPCREGDCSSLTLVSRTPALVGIGTLIGVAAGWTSSRLRWETVWPPTASGESRRN